MAILAASLLFISAILAQENRDVEPVEAVEQGKVIVLRGLDKATGRISTFDVTAGEPTRFGTLEITTQTCQSTPPEEAPETTAFLQIDNIPVNGERARVFSGWMFASSPAVNALEHPVYDVWVIACKISGPETPGGNL